jgi:hypothetical protein
LSETKTNKRLGKVGVSLGSINPGLSSGLRCDRSGVELLAASLPNEYSEMFQFGGLEWFIWMGYLGYKVLGWEIFGVKFGLNCVSVGFVTGSGDITNEQLCSDKSGLILVMSLTDKHILASLIEDAFLFASSSRVLSCHATCHEKRKRAKGDDSYETFSSIETSTILTFASLIS